MSTTRSTLLGKLVELCGAARSRAYYVRRGFVDWSSFPWARHARVISIVVPDETLLADANGCNKATVVMQFVCVLQDEDIQSRVNDTLMDELRADVDEVLRALEAHYTVLDDGGLSPTLFFINRKDATATEFHDPDSHVQGVLAKVQINY